MPHVGRPPLIALLAGLVLALTPGSASRALRAQEDPLEAERQAAVAPLLYHLELRGELTQEKVDRVVEELRRRIPTDDRQVIFVLELASEGGDLQAAGELSAFLEHKLGSARCVIWLAPGARVARQALLVALAGELVLGTGSVLGDDPRSAAALPESERTPLVGQLRLLAARRGNNVALVESLVAPAPVSLRLVHVRQGPDEQPMLLTEEDIEERRRNNAAQLSGEGIPVVRKGQQLELPADKAVQIGLAKHMAENLNRLQLALGLTLPPENVVPLDEPAPVRGAIDFLNLPFIRFLMILCGALALLIEIKTMGTMVPGTIAVLCFTTFFVAHSFPATGNLEGTASVWEIALFVIGVGLLGIEFLLLPGMAIFALTGAALCATSLVLAMIPGNVADLQDRSWGDETREALAIFAYSIGAAGVVFFALLAYLPRSRFLARRGLVSTATISGVSQAESAIEAQAEQRSLLGLRGVAQTTMRPAGKMQLPDGRTLDVVAEDGYVEAGTPVEVARSEDGIIRVRRAGS